MKKVLVSGALSTFLVLPASAIEIYSDDDKKVEIYGSIRGFMGYSESTKAADPAAFLFGLQSNSQFGVRAQMGKFKANVEFGAREADVIPAADGNTTAPYRQYWGSYDTGYGVVLFGKTNSPSFDNGFSSNWLNIDSGMVGFGGLPTAKRHIQLQYNIAGFSIGVLEDGRGNGWSETNQETPRIAANYTINNDKGQPFFKIAGSYKYYNSGSINPSNSLIVENTGTHAYHIWLGLRPTFGNSFLSLVAQYGKNGYLYGEQVAGAYSRGGYTFTNVGNGVGNGVGLGAKIAGGKVEFGTKLSQDVSLILGAGYQATYGGSAQVEADSGPIHSYAAFLQLPYKANANVEVAPQVTFYNTEGKKTSIAGSNKQGSVIAGVRIKWDF